jgi:hypothetical protein
LFSVSCYYLNKREMYKLAPLPDGGTHKTDYRNSGQRNCGACRAAHEAWKGRDRGKVIKCERFAVREKQVFFLFGGDHGKGYR